MPDHRPQAMLPPLAAAGLGPGLHAARLPQMGARRIGMAEHQLQQQLAMAPGAEFRVATDIPDYMRQTLEEVPRAGFALVAEGPEPWDDWHSTRYEQKALREGRAPHYATFRR